MAAPKVASRYAKSLLELAVEQNVLEEVYADMKKIATLCKESKELQLLLKSPVVKTDKKLAIFKELFKNELSNLSFAFVEIITKKKRESVLQYIAESFMLKYKAHKNIVTANVKSSIPLDEDVKKKIMAIVKSDDNSTVELEETIDQSLIGGFVLRVGDNQIDTSIKSKLARLKQDFSKNEYVKEY